MRKNYYAPICSHKDGSIYIHKNNSLKNLVKDLLMIFLLPVFFAAIVMFALIDPFNTNPQANETKSQGNEIITGQTELQSPN